MVDVRPLPRDARVYIARLQLTVSDLENAGIDLRRYAADKIYDAVVEPDEIAELLGDIPLKEKSRTQTPSATRSTRTIKPTRLPNPKTRQHNTKT